MWRLTSVSYTHLDVYKRQHTHTATHLTKSITDVVDILSLKKLSDLHTRTQPDNCSGRGEFRLDWRGRGILPMTRIVLTECWGYGILVPAHNGEYVVSPETL